MECPETHLADYDRVLQVCGRDGLPMVVLGGQAVSLWTERSLEVEPGLNEFRLFLLAAATYFASVIKIS